MDKKPLSDDDFLKRYHSHEKESLDEFIKRYRSTEIELRETIAYLIHHRQLLRDVELKLLHAEAETLLERLKDNKQKQLLEEIRVFKDILALHKRLLKKNDKSGN